MQQKIYIVASLSIDELNALCSQRLFKEWRGVFDQGEFIGWILPNTFEFDLRERLEARPDFHVLPHHHDPTPLAYHHVAKLARHGVAEGDTMWTAAHKLYQRF